MRTMMGEQSKRRRREGKSLKRGDETKMFWSWRSLETLGAAS
jgi:hypothetical protein